MTIQDFIIKIMNMPFKDTGRDYNGGDCYGVVYLGFRDVLNIDLPRHDEEYQDAGDSKESRKNISDIISDHRRKWEQVKRPQEMDVILFRIGGQPIHVGLMIDDKNFIHCEKKRGSSIESINSIRWILRREGFFRLCQA